MPEYDDATIKRFWAKVDVRGPDECWPWNAYVDEDGYGRFTPPRPNHVPEGAHVISFVLVKGPTGGLCVCHTCDSPPCCNPAHLWLGTNQENTADSVRKGRRPVPFGSATANARLTESAVIDIRRHLAAGLTQTAVGRMYGIRSSTVGAIKRGINWAWLETGQKEAFLAVPNRACVRGSKHGRSKLNELQVVAIRELARNGEMAPSVAAKFSVSPATIRDIVNGKRWEWLP